ncbi:MAG TPA: thermonuclease family protein [Ignavibacteria bacterium]
MIKSTIKLIATITFLVTIGVLFYYYIYPKIQDKTKTGNRDKEYVIVSKVVDGDTFKLSNGEKVRLLGIDTPEYYESDKLDRDAETSGLDKKTIRKLGKLASDYVRNFAEGKKVYLVKEPYYDDRDKYGRLLRWVYLEDGTFINGKIISDGYAQVFEKFPVSKIDELRKLQREARENNRGLWGEVEGLKQLK